MEYLNRIPVQLRAVIAFVAMMVIRHFALREGMDPATVDAALVAIFAGGAIGDRAVTE